MTLTVIRESGPTGVVLGGGAAMLKISEAKGDREFTSGARGHDLVSSKSDLDDGGVEIELRGRGRAPNEGEMKCVSPAGGRS